MVKDLLTILAFIKILKYINSFYKINTTKYMYIKSFFILSPFISILNMMSVHSIDGWK